MLKVRGTVCNAASWGDISDCSVTQGSGKVQREKKGAFEDVILLTASEFYFHVTALTLDILFRIILGSRDKSL